MTEPPYRPPFGLLYAGLAFGVLANVLIIVLSFTWSFPTPPIGNIAAVLIVAGAWWLIRQRQKGRL